MITSVGALADSPDPDLITLLKTQYRMNSSIMQISSSYIYADELIADDSVKERSLKDLPRVNGQSPSEEMNSVLEDELNALIWVDTAGKCIGDRQEDQGKAEDGSIIPLPAVLQTASKYNPGEVEIVVSIYKDLRENQRLDIDDIGIIAPYKAQVDLIRNALTVYEEGKPRSEVSTVDGFQGREKEVIVLSLTRSNPEREVGFLADIRRLNVAITRPKRLLIIVGDSQTVKSDPFINEIYSKVQLHGKVMGIYDFLSILKSNGEDDSKIRAHFNSGTHQTNALYKVKEKSTQPQEGEAGGEPKSAGAKKQKKPKKDQPKDQEAKPSEHEVKPEPEAQPKNNHYGISFDLYARIEVLLKWKEDSQEECPAAIKIYGKLEDQERQGLEVFQREHSELVDVKIVTKPKHSLTISRIKKNPKPQTDDGGEDEQSAEEAEGMTESKPDPDEEKRRKNAEKRARQKEAKRKQKEEEDKLAKLTEEEFLAKLLKEKEEKIESMKFCQATIGNTGNKCLKNVLLLGIVCKFCEVKFCATHAFASMHGCDDAEEDYYEQQRKEQLKALKKGGFANSKNDFTSEMLQERLRKMKMEAEEKRKPKTKEEEAKGKGGRGGRGGRGGKK